MIWQADHTELDLLVVDANDAQARPWLTIVEDDCSRAVAGYGVPRRAIGVEPVAGAAAGDLAQDRPRLGRCTASPTTVYHQRPHSETSRPPQQAWLGDGWLPRTPDSLDDLDLLLVMVATPRVVHRDGIRFQGLCYLDPTLAAYVGEPVTIRYDPRDLGEIRVFHRDRFLCRAIRPVRSIGTGSIGCAGRGTTGYAGRGVPNAVAGVGGR